MQELGKWLDNGANPGFLTLPGGKASSALMHSWSQVLVFPGPVVIHSEGIPLCEGLAAYRSSPRRLRCRSRPPRCSAGPGAGRRRGCRRETAPRDTRARPAGSGSEEALPKEEEMLKRWGSNSCPRTPCRCCAVAFGALSSWGHILLCAQLP